MRRILLLILVIVLVSSIALADSPYEELKGFTLPSFRTVDGNLRDDDVTEVARIPSGSSTIGINNIDGPTKVYQLYNLPEYRQLEESILRKGDSRSFSVDSSKRHVIETYACPDSGPNSAQCGDFFAVCNNPSGVLKARKCREGSRTYTEEFQTHYRLDTVGNCDGSTVRDQPGGSDSISESGKDLTPVAPDPREESNAKPGVETISSGFSTAGKVGVVLGLAVGLTFVGAFFGLPGGITGFVIGLIIGLILIGMGLI